MKKFLTLKEAAAALGVSTRHIRRLIDEADTTPKTARWKFGRELIDLSPVTSKRRTIRIHPDAITEEKPARASSAA